MTHMARAARRAALRFLALFALAAPALANVTAAPSVLNLTAPLNQPATPQALTITNASGAPVNFIGIGLAPSGNVFTFSTTATTCFGAAVPNGGTCRVVVETMPQTTPGTYTAAFSMLTSQFGTIPVAAATLNLTVGAPASITGSAGVLTATAPHQVALASSGRSAAMLTYTFNGPPAAPIASYLCTQVAVLPPSGASPTNPCTGQSAAIAVDSSGFTSQAVGTQGRATETIALPEAVTRLSMDKARQTGDPSLYFVREFQGGSYAVVQLQALGSSLIAPLTLTDVRLAFRNGGGLQPTAVIAPGEAPPPSFADIDYTGTGTLRGRWEVVEPGVPGPTPQDLIPEASVDFGQRVLQRRFRLVDRFEYALGPSGRFQLPGPDPAHLPVRQSGTYLVLLRIEAVPARRPGGGNAEDGAAGFSMPVLAYQVGPGLGAATALANRVVPLVAPPPSRLRAPGIAWLPVPEVRTWRVELADARGVIVGSAFLRGGQTVYHLAPALARHTRGKATRWRVLAFDAGRKPIGRSDWQSLR